MADPWYTTTTTTTAWVTPSFMVTGGTTATNLPSSSNMFVTSNMNQWYGQPTSCPFSQEEYARQAEDARRRQMAAEREVERRNASQRRARELLLEHLNARQRREFERLGHFFVHIETAEGRRRYCVRGLGGVDRVARDRVESTFCIHPNGYPPADVMLCQKLLLEEDEGEFLRIANETRMVAR